MGKVPAHMVSGRGFVKAHRPEDHIDEVVMNAQQQLTSFDEYKERIKPLLNDPKQSATANAMMRKLSRDRKRLVKHIGTMVNHERLLVKRLRLLVTPEQFATAVGMARADEEAILSQIPGVFDDESNDDEVQNY